MSFLRGRLNYMLFLLALTMILGVYCILFIKNTLRRDLPSPQRSYYTPKQLRGKEPPYSPKMDAPLKLIIVSQPHSGATYLSSLLQAHPLNTTVWYQPLSDENSLLQVAKNTMDLLMSCNLNSLQGLRPIDNSVLALAKTKHYVSTLENYDLCIETSNDRSSCSSILNAFCQASHVRLLKHVGIGVHTGMELLLSDPQLKMIYLVRDPLDVAISQMLISERKGSFPENITRVFARVCRQQQEDMNHYTDSLLDSDLKERLIFLLYDQLCQNPLQTAKSLFYFLGLPFVGETKQFVLEQSVSTCQAAVIHDSSSNLSDTLQARIQSLQLKAEILKKKFQCVL